MAHHYSDEDVCGLNKTWHLLHCFGQCKVQGGRYTINVRFELVRQFIIYQVIGH